MAFGLRDRDEGKSGTDESFEGAVPLSSLAGPDGGDKGRRLAAKWKEELEQYDSSNKRWIKRGESIEKRYRDERNRLDEEGQTRMNNLWANTQILYPALYGRCPVPVAERRFGDKDPIGRGAAQIIERALRNEVEFNGYHDAIGNAVMDYLLPGRGVVWVRYEPEFGHGVSIPVATSDDLRDTEGVIETDDDSPEGEHLEATGDRVVREVAPLDYIPWKDIYLLPTKARIWAEVRAPAKRCWMSRAALIERFGEEIGDAIPLQKDDREKRNQTESRLAENYKDGMGEVFEIWDIDTKKVYWVATGYEWLCDEQDDPLELDGFFPIPRPLIANRTNNTIIPVPFYIEYQDQAKSIDELSQRIHMLSKACKVTGTYNGAADEIARLFDESVENELIPVDSWAAFAEKGGIQGQISFMPLKEIVEALDKLTAVKDKLVAEMDRLTGITDVLRGVTMDGRETLGGQRLKNSNGKTRLQQQQDEVARFARDAVKLIADVMRKHFSNMSLIEASGALYEQGLGVADVMYWFSGDNSEQPDQQPQAAPPAGPPAPMAGAPPAAGPRGIGPAPAPQPQAPPQMTPFGPLSPQTQVLQALQKIQACLKLLRSDKLGFRVDIEVDSTIAADSEADKEQANEFIMATTKFIQEAGQIVMLVPQAAPLLGKLLQFGVRRYRVARDLEMSIEEFTDDMQKLAQAKAAAPPPPNPEAIKAQVMQQKGQVELAKARISAQADMAKTQADVVGAHEDVRSRQLEMQIEQLRAQVAQIQAVTDVKKAQIDLEAAKAKPPPSYAFSRQPVGQRAA